MTANGDYGRSLYEQTPPSPERCDFILHGNRCINVGKFALVTGGGDVQRFSCNAHLHLLTMELRTAYQAPVMVDLSGGSGAVS